MHPVSNGAILLGIDSLRLSARTYTAFAMDWPLIRRRFLEEWKRRDLKQVQIAKRGGLSQSALSGLLNDPSYVPDTWVFLRAIKGLGMEPSQFFGDVELQDQRQTNTASKQPPDSHISGAPLIKGPKEGGGGGGAELSAAATASALRDLVFGLAECLMSTVAQFDHAREQAAAASVDKPKRLKGARRAGR